MHAVTLIDIWQHDRPAPVVFGTFYITCSYVGSTMWLFWCRTVAWNILVHALGFIHKKEDDIMNGIIGERLKRVAQIMPVCTVLFFMIGTASLYYIWQLTRGVQEYDLKSVFEMVLVVLCWIIFCVHAIVAHSAIWFLQSIVTECNDPELQELNLIMDVHNRGRVHCAIHRGKINIMGIR